MELDKAIEGYFDTRKRLESNFTNPNLISDILFKMSVYLSHIGDQVGELKVQYETDRAASYMFHLNGGKSASGAENLARAETAETRGKLAKLELTLKNGQNLISVGQSRLRVLENEMRNQA